MNQKVRRGLNSKGPRTKENAKLGHGWFGIAEYYGINILDE